MPKDPLRRNGISQKAAHAPTHRNNENEIHAGGRIDTAGNSDSNIFTSEVKVLIMCLRLLGNESHLTFIYIYILRFGNKET